MADPVKLTYPVSTPPPDVWYYVARINRARHLPMPPAAGTRGYWRLTVHPDDYEHVLSYLTENLPTW